MICPDLAGPCEPAPGFTLPLLRGGYCRGLRRPDHYGNREDADDIALFTNGIDDGRYHEHAFPGWQQHELVRERLFGRDVIYWSEVLPLGHGETFVTFKMYADSRERFVWNDGDLHR